MKQMSHVTAPMIREDVIAAIEDIKRSQTLLGQILNTCTWEFGFYCYKLEPFCFAKYMPENKKKLSCTGCKDHRLHDMMKNQQIWFDDPPSSTSQTATTTDGAQPMTPQLTDEPEMRDLARQLHPVPPVDDVSSPTGLNVSPNSNGCDDTSVDTEPIQPSVIDPPLSTSQTTTTDGTQPMTPQLTDEPKMSDLARQLHPVTPQWRAIGGQLGIEGYELDSIGRDQSLDDIDKLTKVCQLWKDKKITEVSWRKILDVIRNRPIQNEDVCRQIETFLGVEPTLSSSMETNQPTGTGESVSMQSSMTETAQEEEKSQPLRQRKINSQNRPVDDSNMNQSEDVSPSESSKCGTCYKLIYACLIGITLLACTYLGYTYYYKEIDTSNTDSILFTPKQLVAIAIAITALISVLFLHIWNNGITKEKLNEILLKIVYFFAWILFIVIISIITGNTKILEDKWQTG